jgi:hypothetical protein
MSKRPVIYRQPIKAVWLTALAAVLTWVYLYFGSFFLSGFDFVVFTFMAYIVPWQVAAHMFENWPASKLSKNPIRTGILQGIIFWVILIIYAWLWLFLTGKPISQLFPFVETSIFVFAAWFFAFENATGLSGKQPLQGLLSWLIITFLGFLLVDYLKIDIPWIWFPAAIGLFLGFQAWPIHWMKQPLKGVMAILLMGAFTWIYYLVLCRLGMDPLKFTTETLSWIKGNLFLIILTFTMLYWTAISNNFPARRLKQPTKGFVNTILGIISAVIIYEININIVPNTFTDMFNAFHAWGVLIMFLWGLLFTQRLWFAGYTLEDLFGE